MVLVEKSGKRLMRANQNVKRVTKCNLHFCCHCLVLGTQCLLFVIFYVANRQTHCVYLCVEKAQKSLLGFIGIESIQMAVRLVYYISIDPSIDRLDNRKHS